MLKFTNKKICCIFNLAAHYRAPIYKLMDTNLNCDFFIITWKESPFKQMDYNELKGFKRTFNYKPIFGKFNWQAGTISLVFRSYKKYIMSGEPYCLSTWIMLIMMKLLGKKAYLWTHGWYGDETTLKKIMKKIFFSLSYKVFLHGDYARNLMIKEGIRTDKLICIYNSLDYDLQCKIRERLNLTYIYRDHFRNDNPVIIYVGRIQKVKKIYLLIEALNILTKEGIGCNLVIVGKEVEKTYIQELIANYNLNKYVWFYGECYDEERIGSLIYNANICVSPGNVGLTAMHSLVYGTPVITHDNYTLQMPEFEAIKKGENGDFFIEGSSIDLSKKIKNWLYVTIKERENIRNKCFKIIYEKYNPHTQIEILINSLK